MTEPDYKEAARKLWMLLDDIDTLDDACRADDAAFRKHARSVQRKRFDVLSGEQFDALAAAPSTPAREEALRLAGAAGLDPAPEVVGAQSKTAQQECARALVEDWHEGIPKGHYNDWCSRAAGLLLHFAAGLPAVDSQTNPDGADHA